MLLFFIQKKKGLLQKSYVEKTKQDGNGYMDGPYGTCRRLLMLKLPYLAPAFACLAATGLALTLMLHRQTLVAQDS
jgi:hypothetical protein